MIKQEPGMRSGNTRPLPTLRTPTHPMVPPGCEKKMAHLEASYDGPSLCEIVADICCTRWTYLADWSEAICEDVDRKLTALSIAADGRCSEREFEMQVEPLYRATFAADKEADESRQHARDWQAWGRGNWNHSPDNEAAK